MKIILLILLIFFTGCAHVVVRMDKLEKESNLELCMAYGFNLSSKEQKAEIKKEIINRHIINSADWKLISRKDISIGMSLYSLYASWGTPKATNITETENSTYIQHIYKSYPNRVYVYTKDNLVTAIQY